MVTTSCRVNRTYILDINGFVFTAFEQHMLQLDQFDNWVGTCEFELFWKMKISGKSRKHFCAYWTSWIHIKSQINHEITVGQCEKVSLMASTYNHVYKLVQLSTFSSHHRNPIQISDFCEFCPSPDTFFTPCPYCLALVAISKHATFFRGAIVIET